jgi:hypothetical protein
MAATRAIGQYTVIAGQDQRITGGIEHAGYRADLSIDPGGSLRGPGRLSSSGVEKYNNQCIRSRLKQFDGNCIDRSTRASSQNLIRHGKHSARLPGGGTGDDDAPPAGQSRLLKECSNRQWALYRLVDNS